MKKEVAAKTQRSAGQSFKRALINTKGDELNTDAEKCIKCCACVKACAKKARKYDTPFASLLSECFKKQKLPQTIL